MSDFEVCPVGTLQRLAAAKARADRAEQCAETEAKRADKAEAERDALLEALDKIACFAPGYGEACEIIAKVARSAIAKAKGGGNG